MKKERKTAVFKALRVIAAAVCAGMLVWTFLGGMTAGTAIGAIIFGGAALICLLWEKFRARAGRLMKKKAAKTAFIAAGSVVFIYLAGGAYFSARMIFIENAPETALGGAKAAILLGCQDEEILKSRLETAAEFARKNPGAALILSGNSGLVSGGDVPEAERMRQYLVERGIDGSRIILEENSRATWENIRFSAEILREMGIEDDIIIITSEFHQYRASVFARREGLKTAALSASTPKKYLLNFWLRECGALFGALFI